MHESIRSISASAYENHSMCNWKFFLQREMQFADVSGPSAILGHISHKVFEILTRASINKHPKDSKIWNPEYLWNISFSHYYAKTPDQSVKIKDDKLKKCCQGVIETIQGIYSPIRDNSIGAEINFYLSLEEKCYIMPDGKYFSITGKIDRIDKIDEETIEIIDYKTGRRDNFGSKDRSKKDSISLAKEIQPRIYHLASKRLYPWAKNIIITFIYLVDGGPVSMIFTDNDIKLTMEMIKAKYLAIKTDKDPQRTRSFKCKIMCPFDKEICQRLWEEKQNLGYEFVQQKYYTLNYKPFRKKL